MVAINPPSGRASDLTEEGWDGRHRHIAPTRGVFRIKKTKIFVDVNVVIWYWAKGVGGGVGWIWKVGVSEGGFKLGT